LLLSCASKSTPPAQRPVDTAATPEAAAVGFDQAFRNDTAVRFDCLPGNEIRMYGTVTTGLPTTSITRTPTGWIVTLSYASDPMNLPRYLVRHVSDGYCVGRILDNLHPPTGPSSPAPYSGSATTSPPQ
jgi:hypothetical protein